jgi:protein gp37
MSDLFHDAIPDRYIAEVFAVMALAPQHTFQVLTKRHARMRSLLTNGHWLMSVAVAMEARQPYSIDAFEPPLLPLPNVWLGVSIENQHWADIRVPKLLDTPAAVRFLSAEPLLGPVDLAEYVRCGDDRLGHTCHGCTVDWVITGGESGTGARPMHPDWARSLRDQCTSAGVPFLFKQWGEWAPVLDNATHRIRFDGTVIENPRTCLMSNEELIRRVGKKAAGRQLDGRTWDEYPAEWAYEHCRR